jgi:pimeloyl-ACP methyl ester carboxylesterase
MLMALLLAGCSQQQLAERIVAAPNGAWHATSETDRTPAVTGDEPELSIRVGPPAARLAVYVRRPAAAPRGSILLLHGILNNHHQQDSMASALVRAGYTTVQVDLRGHGDSTGQYISYGVFDARDLSQVITALQNRGICGDSVGVFGVSYGASSGIMLAGNDPRVAAVVAVVPFSSLRDEAPYFGKHVFPVPAAMMSDTQIMALVDQAGKIAGFDPDAASPLEAIRKTHARILLIHGTQDAITPVEASRKLHAAAPQTSELLVREGDGHLGLSFDLAGVLHPVAKAWFDEHLANPQKPAVP